MMKFNIAELSALHVYCEIFLGVSCMYLITYGTLISFNSKFEYKYPLFIESYLNSVVLVLILSLYISYKGDDPGFLRISFFQDSLLVESLSYNVKNIVLIFSILSLILIKESMLRAKINVFEYLIFILFAILGLLILCSSNDFLTMFLALELQSLAFYSMAAIKKQSSYSVESGLKYFIIGSLASGFFLFGVSIIYGALGTINFTEIHELRISTVMITQESFGNYVVLKENTLFHITEDALIQNRILICFNLGFFFVLVGLFIKISLSPFHMWSPDVYENSPTSSSFFFIVLPKFSVFLAIVKLNYYCYFGGLVWLKEWLLLLVLLSIFVGSFGGFRQRKIKSLLAYSSISHLGFLLMSLVTESFEGVFSLMCYLTVYTGSGICLWSILLLVSPKRINSAKQNRDLTDYVLLRKSNKMICIVMTVVLFSLAGLPPLLGFLVKLNVLMVAIQKKFFLVAGMSVLFSIISVLYYIRIIKILIFEPVLVGKLYIPIRSASIIIPIILFFLIVFMFLNPTLLYLMIYKSCLLFFLM